MVRFYGLCDGKIIVISFLVFVLKSRVFFSQKFRRALSNC